ncbi:MAG TPA: M1 family metallopeptidase [Terriglobales bacterium]|nr:M1 family metallopeptidase [Terriglobales bacterium]
MKSSVSTVTMLVVGAFCGILSAQPAASHAPLSQRVVHYQINAHYNAQQHSLDASEVLTYRNLTGQPLSVFPFHLYLNAFQPQSTWITEAHSHSGQNGRGTINDWKPEDYGSIAISKFEVAGQGDLTSKLQFVSPDDGNPNDKTVAQVQLPKPLAPGESVEFRIQFHDQFPEVIQRTGYKGSFIMGGQWFPKVGVWWHGAWNCHQFHANTEFFADFGVYDVKLTVPANEVVGATGLQTASIDNPNGTKTLTFHAEDVHDFAWTADPAYKVFEDTYNGSAGPVKIRTLMQPANAAQGPRENSIVKRTMALFDKWYGTYPYPQLTVVDPAAAGAGGMEYPTLITAGTVWYAPKSVLLPEVVTEHEFGHQYWYGMVATNEFEEAWLDEGINSYTEVKVLDALYGKYHSVINGKHVTLGEREEQREGYKQTASFDPMTRKAWQFVSDNSYGGVTYGKTASVLLTLESVIGEETMQRAIHTWFERYRFTHPTGTDFMKTVQEVAGQDLSWYFDQAITGTAVLDYEISSANYWPVDWYKEKHDEKDAAFHNEITVHRKGNFVLPVEVEMKFDDGSKVREHWDGKDRWVRYRYDKKAKLVSAEVDPNHKVWLDVDFFNNSKRAEPGSPAATLKLSNYWLTFTEFLEQMLAWGA